ncbi:MAG: sigma-54-dependent Fis family transcriptional regulator [Bdellovibrionales bacterium]|nr:sigma-54-dependent Fis family transcriptional regulator [Bdellovibrionales bacterium]
MVAEQPRVLAVDDNADALYALSKMLAHNGFAVQTAASGREALEKARAHPPAIVLLDVMMPEMDGLEVTRRLKADTVLRFVPVILLTAKDSLPDVVRGLDEGADGYITKPFKPEELLARTRAALRMRAVYEELRTSEEKNQELLKQLSAQYDFNNIIGESASMKAVFGLLEKVARSDSPVLITGPSGTGKELAARAIHFHSSRRDKPFIAKNCAAFTEHLLESQLFGHRKGAFTGAIKDQAGLFEAADGGTLFLDEIGEMATVLQAKLLRVLQEGTFMSVGSTDESRVDVRVLAATNRDLRKMCDEGTFREDLYFRLNVITVELPPLTDRREDIPLLVEHFLGRHAAKRGALPKRVTPAVLDALRAYRWRGNVRELENEIERMLILGVDDDVLDVELLSPHVRSERSDAQGAGTPAGELKHAVEELERRLILQALEETGWNKSTAAKKLGISRSSLISKVQQFGLEE